jgi:DNA invertase Pin-like site-specific DNA recombinase
MDPSKLAISYIRFSKKAQGRGDSLRRQVQQTSDFCQRHGLILDEKYNYRDLGVSAYSGANAESGDLAVFLDLVKEGRVPRGATLVLEKLDRLSRQQPMVQLARIDSLLRAGIRIATFTPDRIYTADDLAGNPYVIYEILSHVMSGYEESAKKSYRCREAWASKRKLAVAGIKMSRMCAPWLTLSEDRQRFLEVPERVALIKRMYLEAAEGIGCCTIAKGLNAEGIPSPKGKVWSTFYVRLLLKDRRVLGELQSYRREGGKKVPIGKPVPGYYPRIIEDDLFSTVQTCISGRYVPRGPAIEKWKVNVFKGLLYDAATGGTMGINTFQDRQGKKRCVRLVVRGKADSGGGIKGSFRFDAFETAFFTFITDLRASDFSGATAVEAERLATLASKLTLASEKIEVIDAEIRECQDAREIRPLLKLKGEFEADVEARRHEYDQLRMRLASPAVEGVADTQTLISLLSTSPDPESLRLKIRARMRQLIRSIWLYVYDEFGGRHGLCQVSFHDGSRRYFVTGYSLTKKPFKGLAFGSDRLEDFPYDLSTRLSEDDLHEAVGWLMHHSLN